MALRWKCPVTDITEFNEEQMLKVIESIDPNKFIACSNVVIQI